MALVTRSTMTESFVEKLKQKCMWCDNIALYECDEVLGMSAQVGPRQRVLYADTDKIEVWTCDALMCAVHRHIRGFYCGKEPGTLDRCPYCAQNEPKCAPMLKEEADAIRKERHALIRRSQFRLTG